MDGLPWYTESRVRRGCSPEELLPGAKYIITVGMSYMVPSEDHDSTSSVSGKVARYAWGQRLSPGHEKAFEGASRWLIPSIGQLRSSAVVRG